MSLALWPILMEASKLGERLNYQLDLAFGHLLHVNPPSPVPPFSDISGQLVFLGTGTSVGVPSLGCSCDVCTSTNPKNNRTRCALALGLPEGTLLVDTPPDLRTQLLREKIGIAQAVLYTHEHADHLFGLDDLRLFPFYLGGPVPLYCESRVEDRIRKSFDYAFTPEASTHPGATPQLVFHNITTEPFELLGQRITPLRMEHGPRFEVLGFRFGNVAYCTDTNRIPPASLALMEGLDILILDALRPRPHITHLSLDEAVEISKQLRPKRTLFTHMCHELDHDRTNAWLPEGMELAYDGLRVKLT
jgi:phosphoribosyl 1,2-cyclic phosphate phosphodiesterase